MVFPLAEILADNPRGVVLRIERSSIHDGAGLRTVVFLKGCPLSCLWCSTPESLNILPERGHFQERCQYCGKCVEACPQNALILQNDKVLQDSELCRGCFACARVCPNEAVQGYGTILSAEDVVAEISRDEVFFFHSGGGVTLSGGECLLQVDFVSAILTECRLRGINTAMETSLHVPWSNVERILPLLDTIFVDLKHADPGMHEKYTGASNDLLLANLASLDASDFSGSLHLRIPLVPGINDNDANLRNMLGIASGLSKLREIEILPYHRLGMATYEWLQCDYKLAGLRSPTPEHIEERVDFMRNQNLVNVPIRVGGGFTLPSHP